MENENPMSQIGPIPPHLKPPTPSLDQNDIDENKDLAAFSYAWIMAIPMLFLKRNSAFVRYHARQSTVLFLLSVIFWFVPYISRLLESFVLIGLFWGFLLAAQGRREEVPFIGPLSRGKISIRESWKKIVAGILQVFQFVKAAWSPIDANTVAHSTVQLASSENAPPALGTELTAQ